MDDLPDTFNSPLVEGETERGSSSDVAVEISLYGGIEYVALTGDAVKNTQKENAGRIALVRVVVRDVLILLPM